MNFWSCIYWFRRLKWQNQIFYVHPRLCPHVSCKSMSMAFHTNLCICVIHSIVHTCHMYIQSSIHVHTCHMYLYIQSYAHLYAWMFLQRASVHKNNFRNYVKFAESTLLADDSTKCLTYYVSTHFKCRYPLYFNMMNSIAFTCSEGMLMIYTIH